MLYLSAGITGYAIRNNAKKANFINPVKAIVKNSIPFNAFFHMLRNAVNSELTLTSSSMPFIVSRYEMGHTVTQTAKLLTKI